MTVRLPIEIQENILLYRLEANSLRDIANFVGTTRTVVQRVCERHGLGDLGLRNQWKKGLKVGPPRNPRVLPPREPIGFKVLYRQYQGSAAKRKLEFTLTLEECIELFSQPCTYCGLAFRIVTFPYGTVQANGIDRVDNNIGYIVTNCVSCCKTCNMAKRAMNPNEWEDWLNRITCYRVEKGLIA